MTPEQQEARERVEVLMADLKILIEALLEKIGTAKTRGDMIQIMHDFREAAQGAVGIKEMLEDMGEPEKENPWSQPLEVSSER